MLLGLGVKRKKDGDAADNDDDDLPAPKRVRPTSNGSGLDTLALRQGQAEEEIILRLVPRQEQQPLLEQQQRALGAGARLLPTEHRMEDSSSSSSSSVESKRSYEGPARGSEQTFDSLEMDADSQHSSDAEPESVFNPEPPGPEPAGPEPDPELDSDADLIPEPAAESSVFRDREAPLENKGGAPPARKSTALVILGHSALFFSDPSCKIRPGGGNAKSGAPVPAWAPYDNFLQAMLSLQALTACYLSVGSTCFLSWLTKHSITRTAFEDLRRILLHKQCQIGHIQDLHPKALRSLGAR